MRIIRTEIVVVAMALVVAIAALVVAVISVAGQHQKYDPLGDYPIQRVDSAVDGVEGPAVLFDGGRGVVRITGTKCSTGNVKVSGSMSWVAVEPPGAVVEQGRVSGVERMKGCTTRTFENSIPGSVTTRVVALAKTGTTRTVWQLLGEECPIAPKGYEPVCRQWQSQNFTIVADAPT